MLMFVCSNLANVFQYLFQSVMKRELAVGDFSLMNSLFASTGFLAIPIGVWTQIWARKFAELRVQGRVGLAVHYLRTMSIYSILYAVVCCAGVWLFLDQFKALLRTDNTFVLAAFLSGVFISLALPLPPTLMQGLQAFGVLAVTALAIPIVRLAFGVIFVKLGWGAAAGLWATMLAGIVPPVVAFGYIWRYGLFRLPAGKGDQIPHWKAHDIWVPGVSVVVVMILTGIDYILVRHLFSPEAADRFTTAAIFGHAMVFFLLPISTVMLPKVVDHFEGWATAEKSVVRKALALSLGIAVLMAAGGTLLAGVALKLFAGKTADLETLSLIRWFVWAMIPTALATLCVNALVARLQGKLMMVCLLVSLALPTLIWFRHATLKDVLVAHFVVGSCLLAVIILGNWKRLKRAA